MAVKDHKWHNSLVSGQCIKSKITLQKRTDMPYGTTNMKIWYNTCYVDTKIFTFMLAIINQKKYVKKAN